MGDLLALQSALADLNLQEHPNISEAARRHGVERSKLSRHWRGVQVSMEEYHESRTYMTNEQAQSLVNYINLLTNRGIPPTPPMVKRFVKDITGIDVGKNYINEFWRKFDDQLLGGYIAPIDLKRKKADNAFLYGLYFEILRQKIKQYGVLPENTYNMDEKGFLLGCLIKLFRIFSKKAWEDGHLNGAGQDGNRNWITILATICADGTHIPPAIIYPSEGSDIQPNWL